MSRTDADSETVSPLVTALQPAMTRMPSLVPHLHRLWTSGLRLGAAFRTPSGVPYSDVNLGVRTLLTPVSDRSTKTTLLEFRFRRLLIRWLRLMSLLSAISQGWIHELFVQISC